MTGPSDGEEEQPVDSEYVDVEIYPGADAPDQP